MLLLGDRVRAGVRELVFFPLHRLRAKNRFLLLSDLYSNSHEIQVVLTLCGGNIDDVTYGPIRHSSHRKYRIHILDTGKICHLHEFKPVTIFHIETQKAPWEKKRICMFPHIFVSLMKFRLEREVWRYFGGNGSIVKSMVV